MKQVSISKAKPSENLRFFTTWIFLVAIFSLSSCNTLGNQNFQEKKSALESQLELGMDIDLVKKIVKDEGLKSEIMSNLQEPQRNASRGENTNWRTKIIILVATVPEILTREKYITCYFDDEGKLQKTEWWQYTRF